METTISQILYPDRQAFFERLAANLNSKPTLRFGAGPMPKGSPRLGSRLLRRAVPALRLSTAQRSMRLKHRSR
jgi:hypothetical protein